MKFIFHLVLILTLLLNSMVYSVIVGSYVINKQEIVDKFCVNKDRPEMQCDGKCFLGKQLQAEKNKKNQEAEHHFSLDFGVYVIGKSLAYSDILPGTCLEMKFLPYSLGFPNTFRNTLFIPPKQEIYFYS